MTRPERDLPRVFTPDTTLHRIALTALLLGIWALILAIGAMGQ